MDYRTKYGINCDKKKVVTYFVLNCYNLDMSTELAKQTHEKMKKGEAFLDKECEFFSYIHTFFFY